MNNANKCEKELMERGIEFELIQLAEPVHSVKDVERACGCEAAEVIKTLLVIVDASLPVLVILTGDKRADLSKIKQCVGGLTIKMATPQEVLYLTGYSVGSVTPFGAPVEMKQMVDKEVLRLKYLFLGGGKEDVILKMSQENFAKSFRGSFEEIGM